MRTAMRVVFINITVFSLGALAVGAEPPAKNGGDEKALRDACQAYVKTINTGDVKAVVKCWTEDADYINDNGEKFKGRAALAKLFNENLPTAKGKKFSFETSSLRMIAPGVAIEDGIGKLTGGDDEGGAGSRYTAVWVKTGNQWLISSVRDLGDIADEGKSAAPLKQIDWLIGDWHSTEGTTDVDMTCTTALEGKFLKQKYDVKEKDGQNFTVVSMIGWDPAAGQIRSWFFDTRGGFGDGNWTRDGNSWKIAASGVVSDGRVGTSTNIWKFTDENNIVWTSKDRQLEGVPMPDHDVKFARQSNAETKK